MYKNARRKHRGGRTGERERGKRRSQGVLFIKEKEKSDIFTTKENPLISLIDWAIVPLRKPKSEEGEKAEEKRKMRMIKWTHSKKWEE